MILILQILIKILRFNNYLIIINYKFQILNPNKVLQIKTWIKKYIQKVMNYKKYKIKFAFKKIKKKINN